MKLEAVLKSFNLDLSSATGGLVLVIATCILVRIIQDVIKWMVIGRKKPPGPTGLPILGYLPFLGKEPYKAFLKLREKYGNVIGVYFGRKYTVVLNEYNVVKQVLSHPEALNRAPGMFEHLDPHGMMNTNGEVWKEQRKYCMNTSQELGLGRGHWEDLIMDEISTLIAKIEEHKGYPVDITNYLMSSLISNIATLLIGRRLSDPRKIEMLVKYTNTVLAYTGASLITSAVPGLRKFCEVFKIAGYDKAAQYNRDFTSFLKEEINRHKTSPEFKDMQDFINAYLNKMAELSKSKNTSHFFSEPELQGNLASLYLGATDTIFSSLGWLFRIMSAHKDMQEKVYQELMEAVGKDGRARYDEREKFPYTFAVLMEAQRYASNIPMTGNRIATGDIPINGYVIPKGTEITANLWVLHRDPNYWDNPEEFRPERFLTADGTKLIKQPQSYAPFSVGWNTFCKYLDIKHPNIYSAAVNEGGNLNVDLPNLEDGYFIGRRNCPGEAIAWMEILLYFSEFVKKFEISTPPGVEPEFEIVLGLVQHLAPQPLCFKERRI